MPQSPRSRAEAELEQTEVVKEMMQEMCDVGLKPVVVFHNLSVAELYEHVSALLLFFSSSFFRLLRPEA